MFTVRSVYGSNYRQYVSGLLEAIWRENPLHARGGWSLRKIVCMLLLAVMLFLCTVQAVAAFIMSFDGGGWLLWFVLSCTGAVLAVKMMVSLSRCASNPPRILFNPQEEKTEWEFRFEDEEVHIRRGDRADRIELPYSRIRAMYEDEQCFYLLSASAGGIIIPKKDIGEDRVEDFRSFIGHVTGRTFTVLA